MNNKTSHIFEMIKVYKYYKIQLLQGKKKPGNQMILLAMDNTLVYRIIANRDQLINYFTSFSFLQDRKRKLRSSSVEIWQSCLESTS